MSKIDIAVNNKEGASWSDLFSKGNSLKAIILALGVMLHATNVYLATTIMPSIIKEIGGMEYYAWNTTIFVVASVIGSVISANQMVRSGPRKAYQIGILLFSIGTLICTLAPTMPLLLIGRFIQGYGGGLLFALSYAMIRLVFTENLWSRAMALVSGMWGVAAFSGPFLGGIFAEHGHWRWSFGVLLLFCVFILITASIILPKERNDHTITPIPYLKLSLLSLAVLSVSIGSVQKNISENVMGVVIALLFLILLGLAEKKKTIRLLPTGAYKISSALGATYAVMALLTIATSVEIYVPYFAQVLYKFTPLKAGYLTVLIAIGWTLSSILFSGYKGHSAKKIVISGAFLMFIGLTGLSYIAITNTLSPDWNLVLNCICLLAIGAGIGMGWPHLLTKVFSLAPAGEEDLTSSSVTTVQLIATSFGAALAGLVTNVGGITDANTIIGVTNASIYLYSSFATAPLVVIMILILISQVGNFKTN
ncbi:MFS transporter [Sphingobacterium sp. BIGb0165]|uniref:MFS transporter n=1 Tax=Sphingobacterium sp. BIGb0165 TaxID=2940615 RepID=UPI0021676EC4|nr:MFS transporter [Sphingobacterium sp. BIGb0165]MCS4226947.1 MFS family permease [Sphingobacterium sp. BIGb0165]